MIVAPNINSFALKEKIEEMVVYETTTMKDIYQLRNKFKNKSKQILPSNVKFFEHNNDYYSFEIEKIKGYYILNEPIEIIFENHIIEIICEHQVRYIKEKYKIELIICQDDKTNDYFSFYNLKKHKGHKYTLLSASNYKIFKNQEEINEYLKKYFIEFIGHIFKSPTDFEKNYMYYFNYKRKFKNIDFEFPIFENNNSANRFDLVKDISSWEFGVCRTYFGSSGIGKSITLIGALKYGNKYEKLGRL